MIIAIGNTSLTQIEYEKAVKKYMENTVRQFWKIIENCGMEKMDLLFQYNLIQSILSD
jgi:hypothetical protein